MRTLKSISDEWLHAICWSSLLLGIFIIQWCVAFIVSGILRLDCDTKKSEMQTFLLLKKNQ